MKKLVVVLMGAGFATLTHARADAACGVLKVSKGDVKIESAQSKTAAPAPEGTKICSGDTIVAGIDSRAKIVMEDGNELNISPKSKIVIENYEYKPAENKKKVLLNVLSGKVRATTTPNMYNDSSKDGQANTFQVKTKSAVAGVRGTDFLTGYNPATRKAEVVTFSGKVEVGQPGPGGQILNAVQVIPGQKTEVAIGQPPSPPKPVPPSQLNQMNQESQADAGLGAPNAESGSPSGNGKSDDKKEDGAKAEAQPAANDKKSADKGPDDQKGSGADTASGSGEKSADGGKQAGGPTDKKQGEAKSDSGSGSGSGSGGTAASGSTRGTGGSTSESSGSRAPAAAPPPSSPQPPKLMTEGPGSGGLTSTPPLPPSLPILPSVPQVQLPPTIPKNDFIDRTVQTGTSKVNVIIRTQGQ